MLCSLLQHPGVLSAFVTDDAGHLITAAGEAMPPSAGVLVLAHATLSAASEFGRRSGSGDCIELVQHHEGGLVLLRGLPHRHALIVRCEAERIWIPSAAKPPPFSSPPPAPPSPAAPRHPL